MKSRQARIQGRKIWRDEPGWQERSGNVEADRWNFVAWRPPMLRKRMVNLSRPNFVHEGGTRDECLVDKMSTKIRPRRLPARETEMGVTFCTS